MKTLVIYYSYSGITRAAAQEVAVQENADIVEIKDAKRPNVMKALTVGCFAAMRCKPWPVEPLDADWGAYDRFILMAPVWAGHPAPAFNAVFPMLPEGKAVSIQLLSDSGKSACRAKLEAAVAARGCTLEDFTDIKTKKG